MTKAGALREDSRINYKELIKQAKERYPMGITFTGALTNEEFDELEKYCTVHVSSVYMSGKATYHIRYKECD